MMRFHVNGKPVKGLLGVVLGVGFFLLLIPIVFAFSIFGAAILTIGALALGAAACRARAHLAMEDGK